MNIRFGAGPSVSVISEGGSGETEGGQTYVADAFRRRAAEAELIVTREEGLTLMDRLDWRRGTAGSVYITLEPDLAPGFRRFSSFPATVKDAGPLAPMPVCYSTGAEMKHPSDTPSRRSSRPGAGG